MRSPHAPVQHPPLVQPLPAVAFSAAARRPHLPPDHPTFDAARVALQQVLSLFLLSVPVLVPLSVHGPPNDAFLERQNRPAAPPRQRPRGRAHHRHRTTNTLRSPHLISSRPSMTTPMSHTHILRPPLQQNHPHALPLTLTTSPPLALEHPPPAVAFYAAARRPHAWPAGDACGLGPPWPRPPRPPWTPPSSSLSSSGAQTRTRRARPTYSAPAPPLLRAPLCIRVHFASRPRRRACAPLRAAALAQLQALSLRNVPHAPPTAPRCPRRH